MALRTIMMASCSDRSVSSVNCSAPPLRMMVHVFAFGQPLKKLYLHTCTWGMSIESPPGLTPHAVMSALPLSSNLNLFKRLALSQNINCQGSYWRLDGASAGLEVTWHAVSKKSWSCNFRFVSWKQTKQTIAPVGLFPTIMVLFRSSSCTLPAQNRSLSAKYWVATSPMGSLDKTTLAPDW